MTTSAPVGILCGAGTIPLEIARSIVAGGGSVHLVAIDGEADQSFDAFPHTRVNWGGIGGMLRAFRDAGCRELVIIGRVRRPDLTRVRPDLGVLMYLPAILQLVSAGGDDGLMRLIVRFFENRGFIVRGPAEVAPDLVVGAGPLGRIVAADRLAPSIALGFAALDALGDLDIGQGVIVESGRLVAVEDASGTDGLLARLSPPPAAGLPLHRILVKAPKPGQEMRVDMPAIGPGTVRLAAQRGLAGLAVAAGGVLAAERNELIAEADAAGIFIAGFEQVALKHPAARRSKATASGSPVRLLGGLSKPSDAMQADAGQALRAVVRLAQFAEGVAAIAVRHHVRAIGIGEDLSTLLQRVPALRQWGEGRWQRARRGALAVTDASGLDDRVLQAAAAVGLAAVALAVEPDAKSSERLVATAGRNGLAVLVADRGSSEKTAGA